MQKYYDPRLFDIETEPEQLRLRHAPKVSLSDGAVLSAEASAALPPAQAVQQAVDVDTLDRFIAAGFDVTFVGPEESLLPDGVASMGGSAGGTADGGGACGAESPPVEESVFGKWIGLAGMRVSMAVARWWNDEDAGDEVTWMR